MKPVRLAVPGGELAALTAGPPDGTPVLLVPGFTGSKDDFGPILPALADAGFRVIAIDQRGQYESPGWGDPAAYTIDALGADVLALAEGLGKAHLVGHSFGGLVARAAVIADPSSFASLVLMDSGPAAIDGGRRERMQRLRPVLDEQGMAGVYAAMKALDEQDPDYVPPPPARAEYLRARFLASDPAGLFGMGDALLAEPDRTPALASTGVPTLVVCGADDDAWPSAAQADMARRLGARYEVIADAAHSPAMENPAATAAALLAFWSAL